MARTTPQSHALAQALPRSAGFALLRPASKPQLDATRIVTMSGTLAINLIAMGLLMMPLAMPPPAVWEPSAARHPIRDIQKEKPVIVEITKDPVKQVPAVKPDKPRVVTPTQPTTSDVVVLSDTGSEHVVVDTIAEDTGPVTDMGTTISNAPTAVQLQYLSAPAPKYPRNAQIRNIEGTVLLQVLVGIDGRPLEVTVSQTSGNRELDEAARIQILKRWSFQPAMKNGHAVQALGLVPVAFSLRN